MSVRVGDTCPHCGHRTLVFFARRNSMEAVFHCVRKYRCGAVIDMPHPLPIGAKPTERPRWLKAMIQDRAA